MRVVDNHIQGFVEFPGEEERYLAVGGFTHASSSTGAVYIISRRSDGSWKSRRVFASDFGVPELWGHYSRRVDGRNKDYYTIRMKYALADAKGLGPVFAVKSEGTVLYLGREKDALLE